MGETIAILIVFILFVSIGMIVYFKMMEGGVNMQKEENVQLQAVKVAQRVSFLPELQCSEENVRKDNCIDLLKIEKAAELIKANTLDIYYDSFGLSNITIREVFPDAKEWSIYSEVPEYYSEKRITIIPISLANYTEKKYYFGLIELEVYLK